MKKRRIFALVTILALVSGLLAAGCAAPAPAPVPAPAPAPVPAPAPAPAPQPEPAIESLLYINSEYDFSTEYPKDWELIEDVMGVLVGFMGPSVLDGAFIVNVNLVVEKLPEFPETTLEDYCKMGELHLKRNFTNYQKVEEYGSTVSGLPAMVSTFTFITEINDYELPQKDTHAIFIKDKVAYIITYDVPTEFYDQYCDRFDLVVNSFKFQ